MCAIAQTRPTSLRQRRHAAAIVNVMERIAYFSSLPDPHRADPLIQLRHAETIVAAVQALTRTPKKDVM